MIDIDFSGTTANSVYINDNILYCANIGDSRAVIGKRSDDKWSVVPISRDHKPSDNDEAQRIIEKDGRVESFKDEEGQSIGPLRVWLCDTSVPGLAMTRSIGDLVASQVGVSWKPEIIQY